MERGKCRGKPSDADDYRIGWKADRRSGNGVRRIGWAEPNREGIGAATLGGECGRDGGTLIEQYPVIATMDLVGVTRQFGNVRRLTDSIVMSCPAWQIDA